MIELSQQITDAYPGENAFDLILRVKGKPFRLFANRRTLRVELNGKGYFFKIHMGVGWKEIIKCLVSLRLPVLGALNERQAIRRLEALGVETMKIAGFGIRGWNPANRQSFLITEELAGTVSLEDFCRDWLQNPPPLRLKRALIKRIAWMARHLHENGVNHRDFYLCHFHLNTQSADDYLNDQAADYSLHLIDLHRTQIRDVTPRRWRDKDLIGLYFSAMDIGLSHFDLLRFVRYYTETPLSQELSAHRHYWSRLHTRACRFYEKVHGRKSPLWDLWS